MTNFWIVLGVSGLAWVPAMLLFLLGGVNKKTKVGGALVCLALWMFMSVALFSEAWVKNNDWNGGYCECGEHWELRATTKSRNGEVTKYYACPECFAEIEQ